MATTEVVVVCEHARGQTEAANARLIAAGSEFAACAGARLVCLIVGEGVTAQAASLARHADEVLVADSALLAHFDPYQLLAVLEQVVRERNPLAMLFSHTHAGMDLAPRLAARLRVAVVSNCLDATFEDGTACFTRLVYRGRLHAKVAVDSRPIVATLQPGIAQLPSRSTAGAVTTLAIPPCKPSRVRLLRTIEPQRTGLDITKSDVVVAGGRGIGSKENFSVVNELAAALGGVAACSRPLVDMGWFGVERQVGLSGNTVKPRLYVACGISGAIEHLHGMREARTIVAINRDPDAPIFRVAHYGLVGDLNEIVPEVTREVGARRAPASRSEGK